MPAHNHPFDDDKLREECGIFGVYGHDDAAKFAALGLHALQHRGQESAGIATFDGQVYHAHRDLGLVGDIFHSEQVMMSLQGFTAVGHVRYSTTGGTLLRNVQPLFAEFEFGGLAVGHNGNFTNSQMLRRDLQQRGCLFQSTTDTEVLVHLIARSLAGGPIERFADAVRQIVGAFSLVALVQDKLVGIRDPMGVRPLVLGTLDDAVVLASETCALDIIGAKFERDVEPGELVVVDATGLRSLRPFPTLPRRSCIFEHIYFARPDSLVDGESIYEVRKRIGAELAKEFPVPADVVVPVPDSGVPAAIGYAQESQLPFELGIIRNHYVGRTFIEPTDHIRHLGVKMKHSPNRAQLDGKRVILVDDSIVRGTTSRKIVEMVRAAGATEVHMRISSPPTRHSCYYGIDTPEPDQLVAAQFDVEEIRQQIGVESLHYVSIDGLYRAMGEAGRNRDAPQYCDACFTGEYPIELTDRKTGNRQVQLTLLAESA